MRKIGFLEIVEQGIYKATSSSAIFDYKIVKLDNHNYELYATEYVTEYLFYEISLENLNQEFIENVLEGIAKDLPIN